MRMPEETCPDRNLAQSGRTECVMIGVVDMIMSWSGLWGLHQEAIMKHISSSSEYKTSYCNSLVVIRMSVNDAVYLTRNTRITYQTGRFHAKLTNSDS